MAKLPESYVRLKKYSLLVEEICKDVNLQGHGFDPGVMFLSDVGSLDLPEWFLKCLYDYVSAQQLRASDGLESPAKKSIFTAEVFRPAKKRKVTSRA